MPKKLPEVEIKRRLQQLLVAIMAVGWYAYQINQARMASENAASQSWLSHQVQINKLKACIDQGTKPCNISTQIEQ